MPHANAINNNNALGTSIFASIRVGLALISFTRAEQGGIHRSRAATVSQEIYRISSPITAQIERSEARFGALVVRNLELGADAPPQRAKYRELNRRMCALKENFLDGISSCIIAARSE